MIYLQDSYKPLLKYNLQFFAEAGSGGEKTEKATPKKREKAREEGQVAKTSEIATALMFISMFSALKILGPNLILDLIQFTKEIFGLFTIKEITIQYASGLMNHAIKTLIGMIAPFFIVAVLVGFVSNFMQVGWHPTTKPLMPKLSNLSPIQGFKRLFSMRSIVELLKALIKVGIILILVYTTLKNYENTILAIYDIPVLEAYALIANLCLDIGIKVGAFFIIVALADYIYQRVHLSNKLKMTKQEVKDEYKQSEGNPEIKSKIRQKMREASMRRMMQDLPKADVIITNPTHFAVAVKYDSDNQGAPTVIAKGADMIAAKIREVAKDNNIQIVENKALARTLFYTVEIGEEIPPDLYQAVAEILAFVYNLTRNSKQA
ncbi:MAG: flagellar biosynthesis protein FlhB [Firmicutes bacterium HGW-Firmicutes-1]|nr:MAG: flagellar biosynthesis protein FlhB [Firmicutes bacterium HGW-Firmicutes-1]